MSSDQAFNPNTPQQGNSTSRLLLLPFELRYLIIQLALFTNPPARPEDCGRRQRLGRGGDNHNVQIATEIFAARDPIAKPGLLATCRQLREETLNARRSLDKQGVYYLDVMYIKNMGLFPTWILPPPPGQRHVMTIYATFRMFARPGGFNPKWYRPPFYWYFDDHQDHTRAYFDLFASYFQHGPGFTSVTRDAMCAEYTIGTLIVDVVPTAMTNFKILREYEPLPEAGAEVNSPLHAPLVFSRKVEPHKGWLGHRQPFTSTDEQFPFEQIGWHIHQMTSFMRAVQPERYLDCVRPLLDGVSVVDVRVDGEKRLNVPVWQSVEQSTLRSTARLGLEWLTEAQERRKKRGLWVGESY